MECPHAEANFPIRFDQTKRNRVIQKLVEKRKRWKSERDRERKRESVKERRIWSLSSSNFGAKNRKVENSSNNPKTMHKVNECHSYCYLNIITIILKERRCVLFTVIHFCSNCMPSVWMIWNRRNIILYEMPQGIARQGTGTSHVKSLLRNTLRLIEKLNWIVTNLQIIERFSCK